MPPTLHVSGDYLTLTGIAIAGWCGCLSIAKLVEAWPQFRKRLEEGFEAKVEAQTSLDAVHWRQSADDDDIEGKATGVDQALAAT